MKLLTGYGLTDGVSLFYEKYHIYRNNVEVSRKISPLEKVSKWWFIRGFVAFFYLLYSFVVEFDSSIMFLNKKQRILFPIIFIAMVFLFFVFAPLLFIFLFSKIPSTVVGNLLFSTIKIILFLAFFFLLRFVQPFKNIYQNNACFNKIANVFKGEKVDYSKIENSDSKRVFTFFNLFIFVFVLAYSILPFVVINNAFLSLIIKALIISLAICVAYELLYVIEYRRGFCPVAKFFAGGFLLLDWITRIAPTSSQERLSLIAMEDVYIMKEIRKKTNSTGNFSGVYVGVKKALSEAGIDDVSETDWLIAQTLGKKRNEIFLIDNLSAEDVKKINKVVKERIKRKPLNKIFNVQNFYGYDFYVDKSVLSPRQETEILVEKALQIIGSKNCKVLDLCTGSGAIAISVAKNSGANITASDISEKALEIAQKNAKDLQAKVKFVKSNLFNDLNKNVKFDIILSNPPYIRSEEIEKLEPEVRDFDPRKSLDGGKDGLTFYKKIAKESPQYLKKDGYLILEIGFDQEKEVVDLLKDKFKNIKTVYDYGDLPRVIIAQKG